MVASFSNGRDFRADRRSHRNRVGLGQKTKQISGLQERFSDRQQSASKIFLLSHVGSVPTILLLVVRPSFEPNFWHIFPLCVDGVVRRNTDVFILPR